VRLNPLFESKASKKLTNGAFKAAKDKDMITIKRMG
jgi:hypothetical protein